MRPIANQSQSGERDAALETLAKRLEGEGIEVERVPRGRLDALSDNGAHQGVILRARPFEYAELADVIAAAGEGDALVLVLDHVTDQGNLGAIVRTAEVVGAAGVVIPSARAAGVGVGAYKTSAGAVMHIPIARVPNLAVCRWSHLRPIANTGEPTHYDYDFWTSKQKRALEWVEKEEHQILASNGFVITPIPTDRHTPASIDIWMKGGFWELKSVTGVELRIKQRIDEGVSKWTRLHNAGMAEESSPRIIIDIRRGTATTKQAIDAIQEKMAVYKKASFDEAYLITEDLAILHVTPKS